MFQKLCELEPSLCACLTRVDANRAFWNGVIAADAAASGSAPGLGLGSGGTSRRGGSADAKLIKPVASNANFLAAAAAAESSSSAKPPRAFTW
jgi:hypothetical protein